MSFKLEITLCTQRCDYSQKVCTPTAVYKISKVIMAIELFSFNFTHQVILVSFTSCF